MEASLRASGEKPFRVEVRDLSVSGFRIESFVDLKAGDRIWLRLPALEARHARVVWVEGYQAGCAFEAPLHPAVLEMIAS